MVSEIFKALNRKNSKSETYNETNRETDSDTDKKLIALIKRNNQISYDDMAISLNLSRSTVSRIVKRLVSNGKLIRHGNTRSGYWEIKKE